MGGGEVSRPGDKVKDWARNAEPSAKGGYPRISGPRALLALSLVTSLCAQTEKIPHSERAFEKAAKGGIKEVEISQAAVIAYQSQVQDFFARTMITDHTAATRS